MQSSAVVALTASVLDPGVQRGIPNRLLYVEDALERLAADKVMEYVLPFFCFFYKNIQKS